MKLKKCIILIISIVIIISGAFTSLYWDDTEYDFYDFNKKIGYYRDLNIIYSTENNQIIDQDILAYFVINDVDLYYLSSTGYGIYHTSHNYVDKLGIEMMDARKVSSNLYNEVPWMTLNYFSEFTPSSQQDWHEIKYKRMIIKPVPGGGFIQYPFLYSPFRRALLDIDRKRSIGRVSNFIVKDSIFYSVSNDCILKIDLSNKIIYKLYLDKIGSEDDFSTLQSIYGDLVVYVKSMSDFSKSEQEIFKQLETI